VFYFLTEATSEIYGLGVYSFLTENSRKGSYCDNVLIKMGATVQGEYLHGEEGVGGDLTTLVQVGESTKARG